MRSRISLRYLLAVAVIGIASLAFKGNNTLGIGSDAPMADRKMADPDGMEKSLNDLAESNGLLVIFTSNTCPYVLAWEDQYPALGELTEKHNIGMVLINSNEAFRENVDSPEEMRKRAGEGKYNTPYLIDSESELANAFGAQTTPHVFLFDAGLELVFEGSINDKFENRNKEATKFWLVDAIEKLVAGEADDIDPADTRQIGCSIKRIRP